MSSEVKRCVFKKRIQLRRFNGKPLFQAKIQVLSEKVIFLIRRQICTIYKWKQSKTVLNRYVGGFWCKRTKGTDFIYFFFLEEVLLWIMGAHFGQKLQFKVKMSQLISFLQTCSFSLHKTLIDGLEWCGLLVDYYNVIISRLDFHSDGTHSLQRIHWWASDLMLNFSKSVPMNKQTRLHLGWPSVSKLSAIYLFFLGGLFLSFKNMWLVV